MKFTGHATLIGGTAAEIPQVLSLLKHEGIETEKNPDLYVRTDTHFGIDEAREIAARAAARGIEGPRLFVLAMPSLTAEAQNALLKTIEEPVAGARFFFLVPSPETLLPTVRSRAQIVEIERTESAGIIDAHKFLRASPSARLELLKPLFEKDDDDRRDLSGIVTFLSSLERILSEVRPLPQEGIEAVYRARGYMGDKGALVKPLLESVALLAPVLS